MAVTAMVFLAAHEEFQGTPVALVEAKLAEAAGEVDSRVFGKRTATAVQLLAAHKLSLAPYGASARRDDEDNRTPYLDEYERLARVRAGGPWVVGVPR